MHARLPFIASTALLLLAGPQLPAQVPPQAGMHRLQRLVLSCDKPITR